MNLTSRNTDVKLKIALLFVIGFTTLFTASRGETAGQAASVPTAKIGSDNVVKLEVASTEAEIQRGLMYRTSLAEDQGMVFLFRPAREVNFWMYHTLIPLDMLFIKNGKITKIFANVPPCHSENPHECPQYPSGKGLNSSEVVELQAGYAAKHKISEGDPISFDLPEIGAAH